jgi:transcriptional regulator with XRE-family HTH domain
MRTGMDLKLERTRRRVTTIALAERAGWNSRQRISQIEALAVVPNETADRYLAALLTFPDVTTSREGAA